MSVSVLLDSVDQVDNHFRLGAVQIVGLVNARNIVGSIFSQVGVHPHPHLPSAADEHHLLANIEISHPLIQNLKPL